MPANKLKTLLPVLVGLAGLGAAFVIATAKPAPQPSQPSAPPPPEVRVLTVSPQTLTLTVRSQGTVSPRRQVDLVAEVGGRIVSTADSYAEGEFFAAGDALLQIDRRDYEIEVVRARSRVADARQLLASERGRARQARREWRDLGSEEANDLFLRKPQLASAQAQLEAAEADLRKALLDLERCTIRAPFAGRLRSVKADLGQYVTPGTAIATIYARGSVEIALPLSERQLALLKLPMGYSAGTENEVAVTVHSQLGGETVQRPGRIRRTAASIDEQTRLVYAVAEVTDPFAETGKGTPLAIGQFVEVDIPSKPLQHVSVLPASALHPEGKLWRVDADNRLQVESVEVLQADRERVAIRHPSDKPIRVVTSYLANAVDGMAVQPIPAAQTTEAAR